MIPKKERGKGIGDKVMNELLSFADKHNYIISLHPTSDYGGKVSRLEKFYKRYGFIKNSGRNKDFRTQNTLIRHPINSP